MLKTLIKKQLLELNKSFFVDRKTGKGKSARSATFSIVLYILLMILAIGGMFCYMSYSMRPLITYGMSGNVLVDVGIKCTIFSVLGNWVGSGLALKKGAKVVRPIMIVAMLLLLGKIASNMFLA